MATRCCWPPDISPGLLNRAVAQLDPLEDLGGLVLGLALVQAGEDHREHHVLERGLTGMRLKVWKM